jgi:hypothetical protein
MIEFERVEAEPWDCLTKYAVKRDGELLGWVKKVELTTHSKHGRIIYHTFHPKEWRWERPNEKHHDRWWTPAGYRSRESATRALVEDVDQGTESQ